MTFDLMAAVRGVVREEIRAAFAEAKLRTGDEPATYAEAARFAKCSVSTVQNWVTRGLLPATGKGKLRRVLLADVRAVLEGMRARTPATIEAPKKRALEILRGIPR